MPETYMLDLRNTLNRVMIARAKPGQEIQVLVRPEDDKMKPIMATGSLCTDGESFSVVVTRNDGNQQTHIVDYKALIVSFSAYDLA